MKTFRIGHFVRNIVIDDTSSQAKGTKSTSLRNEVDLVPLACEDVGDSTYVMLLKIYTSSGLSILIHRGYSNFGMNMSFISSVKQKSVFHEWRSHE